MKRAITFILLLSLILAIHPASAEQDHEYADARGTADFMQEHYGITILIGPECSDMTIDSFTIGDKPKGRTPLFNGAGLFNYSEEIKIIDDAFSFYPPGFFSHFTWADAPRGLRILLVNQIETAWNQHLAGVTTVEDRYCNIFLGVGAFNESNIHHELWHAMEEKILAEQPDAFDSWHQLNPEGFAYGEEYAEQDLWEDAAPKDDWFARGYSTVNEQEDRATVIEEVFRHNEGWWQEHPFLQRKLYFMLEAAKPVFGDVYFHE